MRNKFTRSLALGMAFATAFTFTAPNGTLFSNPVVAQAAVAKKAVKGTSKITVNKTKVSVNKGETATVKVTLNKKQKKAVKVTLKSSKSSIAKVPASVTVKKNAKAASFKITGKKAGTSTVTASFKTSTGKTKKATIKVTVKAAEKNEDNVVVTEGKITIGDDDGLQTDGTALLNDTLRASFAADLGTIDQLLWYCDGAAQNTASATASAVTTVANKAGEWYAIAITTKGTTFKSNTIKVSDVEQRVTIKTASLENDYTTPANIVYSANDNKGILTVKLSKDYKGRIIVYAKSDTGFTTPIVTSRLAEKTAGAPVANTCEKSTSPVFNSTIAALGAADSGYYYVASDGSLEAKISNCTLVRGTEYIVTFDQDGVGDDTVPAGTINSYSEAQVAPYLTAPESIVVSEAAVATAPTIDICNKDGVKMSWFASGGSTLNAGANTAGGSIASATIYNTSSAVTTGGTATNAAGASAVNKGSLTFSAAPAGTNSYWYAIVKFAAGIYGKTAITLTSASKASNTPAANRVDIIQNADTATTATVKINNLMTDGTVYVIRTTAAVPSFNADNSATYTAKASVTKGSSSVDIPLAIDSFDSNTGANNIYVAKLVPDNNKDFSSVTTDTVAALNSNSDLADNTLSDSLTISQKATTFTVVEGNATAAGGGNNFSHAYTVTVNDQFGDAITGNLAAAITNVEMDYVGTRPVGVTLPGITINANKTLTLATSSAGDAVGATYSVVIGKTTFTLKRVADDTDLRYSLSSENK